MRILYSLLIMLIFSACENSDTITGSEKITLNRAVAAGELVTATVKNSMNTLIRTDTLTAGTMAYFWDEKDEAGNLVEDGLYLIRVATETGTKLGDGLIIIYRD